MARESLAEYVENVGIEARGFAAFGDGDGAAAGDDALEGLETDEGIAANLLAAFDGLEEETFAFGPGGAEEGGDGGFEVGGEDAADGDEGVVPGEGEEVLAVGEDGFDVHRLQCIEEQGPRGPS